MKNHSPVFTVSNTVYLIIDLNAEVPVVPVPIETTTRGLLTEIPHHGRLNSLFETLTFISSCFPVAKLESMFDFDLDILYLSLMGNVCAAPSENGSAFVNCSFLCLVVFLLI